MTLSELIAENKTLRTALEQIVRLNVCRPDADVQQATYEAAMAFKAAAKLARAALHPVQETTTTDRKP